MEDQDVPSEDLWRTSLYPSPSEVEETFAYFTSMESEESQGFCTGSFPSLENERINGAFETSGDVRNFEGMDYLEVNLKQNLPAPNTGKVKDETIDFETYQLNLQVQALSMNDKNPPILHRSDDKISQTNCFPQREDCKMGVHQDPQETHGERLIYMNDSHAPVPQQGTSKRITKFMSRDRDNDKNIMRQNSEGKKGLPPDFQIVSCLGCSRCLKAPNKATLISCPVCRVLTPTGRRRLQQTA